MAIKLKNKPRAQLHPQFWDAVDIFTEEVGLSVVKLIRGAKNERHAKQLARDYAKVLQNMKAIRDRDPELETTLIHSEWDEITSNGMGELVFVKDKVIMRPIRRGSTSPIYDAGRYTCVVQRKAFSVTNPNSNHIQFRPDIDLEAHSSQANHPHQKGSNTCWGGYGKWVMTALRYFNLADLQNAMYKFVTHYTPGDTLAHPSRGQFRWFKEVPHESNN